MLTCVALLLKITTLEYVTPSAVTLGSLMSVSAAPAPTAASSSAHQTAGAFQRQYLRTLLTRYTSAGMASCFSATLCVRGTCAIGACPVQIDQNIPRLGPFAWADDATIFQFIHDPCG